MKNVILVRNLSNDQIMDVYVKDFYGKKVDLDLLQEKWSDNEYYIQDFTTSNLKNFFTDHEISTMYKIICEAKSDCHNVHMLETMGSVSLKELPKRFCFNNINSEADAKMYNNILWNMFEMNDQKVSIVFGEGNTRVYNEETFRKIHPIISKSSNLPDAEKTIVIGGPILMIDDDFKDERYNGTIFTKLTQSPNCILYYSDKRQKEHFRLGRKTPILSVYTEEHHTVAAGSRVAWFFRDHYIKAEEYNDKLTKILNSENVQISTDPKSDFIFLTRSELKLLEKVVRQEGLEYDECDGETFKSLIDQHNITSN